MRIFSVVGQKNSGKTTLLVAMAREFRRQGKRVMTIKHASHPADADREGTDTWRHFHEGNAERVLIASPDLRVIFERSPDTEGPEELARRYFQGADIVLVEGFKGSDIPRVEVYRTETAPQPLYHAEAPNAKLWVAILTDSRELRAPCRVLRFSDTMWLHLLTSLAWEHAKVLDE
jgi:molybdopterin-guanine dinucleotide biosynthesis protein B